MRAGRVIYVHRTQGRGVEGIHMRGIAGGLRTRGYDVEFVGPGDPSAAGTVNGVSPAGGGGLKRLLSRHAPEVLFEAAEMGYNWPAAAQLRAALAEPATMIYERYAIFAEAGSRAARRAGIPHVLEVNYTAHTPLVRARSGLLKPLAVASDRRVFANARLLVTVSSYLRDHLVRDYGIDPHRIVVTPNAADPATFDPGVTPVSTVDGTWLAGKFVIGFVGTFAPWHGLNLLIEAFERIAGSHPDAVLLLIGEGPERAAIVERAAIAGLGKRVLCPGEIPNSGLAPYLARFDAAVLPDTNEYGSPMKLFEYLALGRPIIAPDYGPVLDVLDDGDTGLIFARRDVSALADRLETLIRDRESARALGLRGRDMLVARRTWLHNVDTVLAGLGWPCVT
jgi:glycosyltransferase involved in cell wall biosynthesis